MFNLRERGREENNLRAALLYVYRVPLLLGLEVCYKSRVEKCSWAYASSLLALHALSFLGTAVCFLAGIEGDAWLDFHQESNGRSFLLALRRLQLAAMGFQSPSANAKANASAHSLRKGEIYKYMYT